MQEHDETTNVSRRQRRWVGIGAVLGAGMLAGGIVASTGIAGAATPSAAPSSGAMTGAQHPAGDPAAVSHGPGETLETGADLSALTSAAKAAVPRATIIRIETDSNGGAVYEAHMQRANGTYVTVQFDANLNVTGTVDGFGRGGAPGSAN